VSVRWLSKASEKRKLYYVSKALQTHLSTRYKKDCHTNLNNENLSVSDIGLVAAKKVDNMHETSVTRWHPISM